MVVYIKRVDQPMALPSLDKVAQVLRQALSDHLAPGGENHLELSSEDAVFKLPRSPGGGVHVEGKQKMAACLQVQAAESV